MAAMRSTLVLSALAVVGMVVAWLFAGRQLVLLVDRFATCRVASLPAGPLAYSLGSPGTLTVGDSSFWLANPGDKPADLRVDIAPTGRLVLRAGGKAFPLGIRTDTPDDSGRPDVAFAPDPGDDVAFRAERSLFGWPTPFEMNFMTGHVPSWRRNVYYRLLWRKRTGASLDMVWRYEQGFYGNDGWTSPGMTREGATGLVRARIVAGAAPETDIVEEYLTRTKGWARGDYRLESRGVSADGRCDVVLVIHRLDESGAQPGGGRSVELYVDRVAHRIDKELGLQ
jgi:hypothetical protein